MDLKYLFCLTFLLSSYVAFGNSNHLENDHNGKIMEKSLVGNWVGNMYESAKEEAIGKTVANRSHVAISPLDQDSLILLRENLIKNKEYYKNPNSLRLTILKYINDYFPGYLDPLNIRKHFIDVLIKLFPLKNSPIDKIINVDAILPNINYLLNENGIELQKQFWKGKSLIEVSDKPTDSKSFQNLRHLLIEKNEILTNPCNLKFQLEEFLEKSIPSVLGKHFFINIFTSIFSFEVPFCKTAARVGFGPKSINVEAILPGINYIIETIHKESLDDSVFITVVDTAANAMGTIKNTYDKFIESIKNMSG